MSTEAPDEPPEECDNCGYETKVERYEEPVRSVCKEDVFWLCEVCANTHLSKAIQYPAQCSAAMLYKSIGWIANRLLDEIKTLKQNAVTD